MAYSFRQLRLQALNSPRRSVSLVDILDQRDVTDVLCGHLCLSGRLNLRAVCSSARGSVGWGIQSVCIRPSRPEAFVADLEQACWAFPALERLKAARGWEAAEEGEEEEGGGACCSIVGACGAAMLATGRIRGGANTSSSSRRCCYNIGVGYGGSSSNSNGVRGQLGGSGGGGGGVPLSARLVVLSLPGAGLTWEDLRAMLSAPYPRLEALDLSENPGIIVVHPSSGGGGAAGTAGGGGGSGGNVGSGVAALAAAALPRLRSLTLDGCHIDAAAVRALASASLWPRLESLDVSCSDAFWPYSGGAATAGGGEGVLAGWAMMAGVGAVHNLNMLAGVVEDHSIAAATAAAAAASDERAAAWAALASSPVASTLTELDASFMFLAPTATAALLSHPWPRLRRCSIHSNHDVSYLDRGHACCAAFSDASALSALAELTLDEAQLTECMASALARRAALHTLRVVNSFSRVGRLSSCTWPHLRRLELHACNAYEPLNPWMFPAVTTLAVSEARGNVCLVLGIGIEARMDWAERLQAFEWDRCDLRAPMQRYHCGTTISGDAVAWQRATEDVRVLAECWWPSLRSLSLHASLVGGHAFNSGGGEQMQAVVAQHAAGEHGADQASYFAARQALQGMCPRLQDEEGEEEEDE